MPKRNSYSEGMASILKKKQESELAKAQARIKELENQLPEGGVIEIPLEKIQVNSNQPRKSFFDVIEMEKLLLSQGQKQPIILVEIPREGKYLIFDGERRYRAHQNLGWATIKAFFIPYDPDTFDLDVLITSLNKKQINALDEAEAIIAIIQRSLPLEPIEIASKLRNLIAYLQRQKQLDYLSQWVKEKDKKAEYSELIQFREEAELIICDQIIYLGRSPITVSSRKFPLLQLLPDLKAAIRERGLNDRIALHLNQIQPSSRKFKGKIEEAEAFDFRLELLKQILEQELPTRAAATLINQKIAERLGEQKQSSTNSFAYLDRIDLDKLSESEKFELKQKLETLLSSLS